MTADLSAIIARLEAAEAGSRELDAHVEVAARAFEAAKTGLAREHWAVWRANSSGIIGDDATQYASEPVTTSLDAALALAERVLPGKEWMLVKSTEGGETSFHALIGPDSLGRAGEAASAALALCIAILRAKQGEGE